MKKVLVIVGVLILCASAVFFLMNKKPEPEEVREGVIVIVGDSLVSGKR